MKNTKNMKKIQLVETILETSKIHHNISILWNKMPDDKEEDIKNGFDWNVIAGEVVSDFAENWKHETINDKGNRNLCGCNWKNSKNYNPKNILKNGACEKHDLWNVYTCGRSNATLYWTKYWNSSNSGFYFKYDEDELQEMQSDELKTMLKEMNFFNEAVDNLMIDFYAQCEYRLNEIRKEAAEEKQEAAEEKQTETQYQKIKKTVEKNGMIKRLVGELLP